MRISDWSSDVCSSDLKQYDVFVRLRDDLYIPYTFKVTPALWKGVVGVQLRCGWNGYNDKAAISDAQFGFQYLVNPTINTNAHYDEMRNQTLIVNSETILRASLALDNVPAKFLTPEELPFLVPRRSEEHPSELQSLIAISYAV